MLAHRLARTVASALGFQALYLSLTQCVAAQMSTSLYIPGFDPQPVSAHIAGVGSDGRTTWILQRGTVNAADTSSYAGFFGTATLVEGPNDASLTYADSGAQLTFGEKCTFTESTLAVCTVVAQGSTATQTEFVTRLPIQGGATLTGTVVTTTLSAPSTNSVSIDASTTSSSPIVTPTPTAISPNSSRSQHGRHSLQTNIALVCTILVVLSMSKVL